LQRVRLLLGKKEVDICPVLAILPYLVVRGITSGALIVLADGKPLTCYHLTSAILSKNGMDSSCYNMHSFHIGVATLVKEAGISESQVQLLK